MRMSHDKSQKKRANKSPKGDDRIDPHSQREKAKYDKPIASREFILSSLREESGPVDFEALAEKLDIIGNDVGMEALRRRVGAMIRDGQLIQNRRRGLVPVDADNLLAGRITAHPDGFGFVVVEDSDKDVYLNGKQMRQVLHGDKVVVCITGIDHRGRQEGRIVDVVERANKSLVGRLSIDRGTAVVLPDNKRIHQDLLIAQDGLQGAEHGDMVVAEIVEQPTRRHQPVGKVVEVLGQHLRPGMEIDVALHSHGIPVEWPEGVLEQAASFSTTVEEPSSSEGRMDVRSLPLITIDGADARDFDDAVWCEPLDDGWRLLVAIADVAHYVSVGSALDNEAVDRGTSVYFPGRVVPMLPEVLSNGLCSLNPDVDRLCMICELTLSGEGDVKKTRFHNGILRSHARLTYDQVNEMLTDEQSDLREQHAPLVPMIEQLHQLYKVLAAKRRERGAIEFDSNETHIVFDENKKIKEIVPIQRNDAHKLIEECMILANIQAAAYLEEKEIPALYRVHAGPKADRLEDLRSFLALRSLGLGGGDQPSALDYAALAAAIADRVDRSVIQTVMLRSMQQAVYQPKNEGHFGLALNEYAHFTSPIRRYPDLLVHRALKHAISRGKASDYQYSPAAMVALGESCSMTERRAEDASRDVVSWLKCEYMQDHVGSEFDGVISAVTSFGLFVELVGIHTEGLIHITNLSRDYYKFEQAAQALIGERTGRQYRLGDPIRVRVAAVNLEDRKIDFEEAGQAASTGKPAFDGAHKRKGKRVKKGRGQPQPAVAAAVPTLGDMAKTDQTVSAEERRKQKRKAKQKRRDQKRKDRFAAKKALELQNKAEGRQPVEVGEDGRPLNASAQNNSQAASDTARENVTDSNTVSQKAANEAFVKSDSDRNTAKDKKLAGKKIAGKKAVAQSASTTQVSAKKTLSKKSVGKAATATKRTGKKAAPRTSVAERIVEGKKAVQKAAVSAKAVVRQVAAAPVVGKKAKSKKSSAQAVVAKKVASKKVASKKVAAKKDVNKKVAAQQVVAKKALSKKANIKKVSGKKVSSKKLVSKTVAATQAMAKKAVSKTVEATRAVAKNAGSRDIATKRAAVQKAASKKVAAIKAVVQKTTLKKKATAAKADPKKAASGKNAVATTKSKKTTAKKVAAKNSLASKKVTTKKVAPKPVASKKIATKKVAAKKVASKKVASKKVATKKVATKKVASKKVAAKKAATKKIASKSATSAKSSKKKAVAKVATKKKATTKKTDSKKKS